MFTTLVSARELSARIENPHWVVVDCRHDLMDTNAGHKAWKQGHIPNAHFAHLDNDLSGAKTAPSGAFHGRHPLPDKQSFIHTLRAWGIDDSSQVVTYDAHGGMFAARLWWMLRWFGHAGVAVLDGGLQAWQAEGYALTDKVPTGLRGNIQARNSLGAQVSVGEVLANLGTNSRTVVDARSPDRYRGENETIDPVGGHIPGAVNRFFKDNLQTNGCFKPQEQLFDEWREILSDASKGIMQCGSGVTACHNLLALEIAGMKGAALYPGSWSEWCSEQARPVAKG